VGKHLPGVFEAWVQSKHSNNKNKQTNKTSKTKHTFQSCFPLILIKCDHSFFDTYYLPTLVLDDLYTVSKNIFPELYQVDIIMPSL
jgi:hypothetical protein